MVNKFIGIGHLGKDPEIRTIESGKVASFSLALTEKWKDRNGERQEKTNWINCSVFGPKAEVIEKYVKKGDKIYIEGKISIDSYMKDEVKMYATKIIVQDFTMLGGKPETDQSVPPAMQSSNQPSYEDDYSDDLPF